MDSRRMSEAASPIDALRAIMVRLRDRERGCPWDKGQTFETIAPYTIEEAYEVADAIARGDLGDLRDELGDLLLQVVFHSRMAEEQGAFDFDDVARGITAKLERRHPHVFADVTHADDAERSAAWEAHKRAERAAQGELDASALAGVATGLPEWLRAIKLQTHAARVGFDWPGIEPVFEKLHEEIDEVRAEFAREPRSAEKLADEIGDLLFVCLNIARHAKVDAGAALRGANAKFERRFRRMEALADARATPLPTLPLDAQDALWNEAKREERTPEQLPKG